MQSKCIKDVLKSFSSVCSVEFKDDMLISDCKGIPAILISRINNFSYEQKYIIYWSLIAKYKKSVPELCQLLHISPEKYHVELRCGIEKLSDFMLNNNRI